MYQNEKTLLFCRDIYSDFFEIKRTTKFIITAKSRLTHASNSLTLLVNNYDGYAVWMDITVRKVRDLTEDSKTGFEIMTLHGFNVRFFLHV